MGTVGSVICTSRALRRGSLLALSGERSACARRGGVIWEARKPHCRYGFLASQPPGRTGGYEPDGRQAHVEPDVGVSHAGVCSNVSRPSDDEHGLGRAVRPAASGLGRVTPYKNDTMHVYPARPRCGQKYVQYYRLYAHYPPAPVLALHVGFKSGMRFSNSVRHLTIGPNTAQY